MYRNSLKSILEVKKNETEDGEATERKSQVSHLNIGMRVGWEQFRVWAPTTRRIMRKQSSAMAGQRLSLFPLVSMVLEVPAVLNGLCILAFVSK